MKKILVTGAAGYIGAHTIKKLAEHGYDITATDYNFQQNNIGPYVSNRIFWDIKERFPTTMSEYDTIIHLAAQTMVEKSVRNPILYYKTNVLGTINLIEHCTDDTHFIYCSTGSAFNPSSNPYAMSKRAAEDIASALPNYSICRFYNVSGNDGFRKYDDSHYHLIRKAAAVANGLYNFISVYGTDYNTKDGTAIRNYTHVNDITDSIIRIVQHGPTHSVECLGTASGHSVLEVLDTMNQVNKTKLKVSFENKRMGDIDVSTLPNQSVFFTEKHTLSDQCISALQWER